MNTSDTLREAVDDAKNRGFTHSFKIQDDGLACIESGRVFQPNQIVIVNHDRFEGPSSEDDASVLYHVATSDGTMGTIVDAYGTYADARLAEFLRGVAVREGN